MACVTIHARAAVADRGNAVFVSAASGWENSTKYRIGKLPGAKLLAGNLDGVIAAEGFAPLPVTIRHGERQVRCRGRIEILLTAC